MPHRNVRHLLFEIVSYTFIENSKAMSSNKNKTGGTGKGSVEDAAKAVKRSQEGGTSGESQESGGTEDQGGEQKSGEEQPQDEAGGAGSEGDTKPGEAGAGTESAGAGESQESASGEEKKPDKDLEDLSKEESEETDMPVPDAAACEKFAKQLAKSPAHLESFRNTLAMADAMVSEKNKGPKKTVEEMETANYLRLVDTYGKDFVTAARGTNKGYYSRKAWNAMKNKRGWIEVTKAMPEAAKAEGTTDK